VGPDRRRARTLLIGAFLIFFLPIAAAWLLNVFAPDWRPFGTTNHGTLVQPVRSVTVASLRRPDGTEMATDYLSGRWTLVHLPDGVCGQSCTEALARSRQVQQALGDDMHRVQLLLVVARSGDAPSVEIPPEVSFAVANSDWLASFSFDDSTPERAPWIYLVDPQGYLMMRYPQDVDRRGLLADLERLLKISQIG
jgi:cytochrome oxidase Cu insertion factor (SCO1/SenC/PrrC family)